MKFQINVGFGKTFDLYFFSLSKATFKFGDEEHILLNISEIIED